MSPVRRSRVNQESLDALFPLHLTLAADGRIGRAGPTLVKVAGELSGRRLDEAFDIRRPARLASLLATTRRTRVRLLVRDDARTELSGLAVPMNGGGHLVALSFGIGVVDAVARFGLTAADFSPTDMTVELLYLVEAKSAALEATRDLSRRLDEARRTEETLALTDALTGLANRRGMARALERMIAARKAFGLMHVDLDWFKAVNDTLGHAAGDHVLTSVAATLRRLSRRGDVVARVGGDEFVVIFQGITDPADLDRAAQRIITELEKPIVFEGTPCRVSASIGTSTSDLYDPPDPDRILSDADTALYASKRAGRARHTLFRPGLDPGVAAPEPSRH